MLNKLRRTIIQNLAGSYLKSSEHKMFSSCEKKTLTAFQYAAANAEYYKQILASDNVDPRSIKTIDDFKKKVPIIDKLRTFIQYENQISKLVTSGNFDSLDSILCSSGTSGAYSFGLLTTSDEKWDPVFVDFGLNLNFDIFKKKTLLINCLPMGVKVPSHHCVVADISVRKDTAIGVVKGFGTDFDLIIMIGENSFIKEVLEFGSDSGIQWGNYNIRIVLGEEGFPENFRQYLGRLLGYDELPENKTIIGSSMGISELGLTVFQENKYTIALRRFIEANREFRSRLFGPECELCPMLFVFYPMNIYLEEDTSNPNPDHIGNDLLFTKLDIKSKIILIRYASGDRGKIIRHSTLTSLLKEFNRSDLIPPYELPFVAVFERGKLIGNQGHFILAEAVKAGIYATPNLPEKVTGNFKVRMNKDSIPVIEIQLKQGIQSELRLENEFKRALSRYNKGNFDLALHSFSSFPYPLDYERKFKYID